MTFDARSRKALTGVHPDLVKVMEVALERSPVKFVVTEGLRTVERQRHLFARGATKTMNSRHITGHAVDIVPYIDRDGDGNVWEDIAYDWPLYHKVAPVIKQVAKELNIAITWGGDWRTFKDGPHFELNWKVYPK